MNFEIYKNGKEIKSFYQFYIVHTLERISPKCIAQDWPNSALSQNDKININEIKII